MDFIFRAWDKWNQKMIAPNGGDFIGWHGPSNWKDIYEVMLYSGHLVNNVCLYDGDIVRNTKMDESGDENEYLVCCFIKEWAMFGMLTIDEYHNYQKEGAECLDEYMFWTFPIEDKDNEQRRICGNIYENKNLLQSL